MSFNTHLLDQAIAHRRDTQEQQRQQILAQVVHWLETVGSQHGIEQAYIFGSLTRPGDFTEASDVDIAISGKLPEEFCTLISLLSTTLGREVDLIQLEECHFGAIKNLLKVGQTYVGMTPSALVPLRFTGVSDDLPNNFLFDAEPWLLGLTPTLTFISK